MATITKPRRAPAYEPTPEQIAAELEFIHARRLAAFEERWAEKDRLAVEREAQKKQARIAKRRAKGNWGFNILNSMLQESDSEPFDLPIPEAMSYDNLPRITICGKVPVGPDGPQAMSVDDRRGFALFEANAELDRTAREERWTLTGVEPDDVVAPTPRRDRQQRDVIPFRAAKGGHHGQD